MSNKQSILRLHNLIKNTSHRKIINFSSTNWTDTNSPSLNLSDATWTTPNGDVATLTNYSGLNNHKYQVSLSGSTYYISEVANEQYTHTWHTSDGSAPSLNIYFISPRTLIFQNANSTFINFNQYFRLYIDETEYKIQNFDGSLWRDLFKLNQ